MDNINRKLKLDGIFWCTDGRHVDDLLKMLEEASFNGDNGRYGGYGFSFEVPSEKKIVRKLQEES